MKSKNPVSKSAKTVMPKGMKTGANSGKQLTTGNRGSKGGISPAVGIVK